MTESVPRAAHPGRPERPEFLTIPEAAAELRISVPTVRNWIAQGVLPSVRPGRKHLIPASEVDRKLGR